jgi:phage FluMu protein gp41
MTQIEISDRQVEALYRVVSSMNNISGRISVTHDDMLSAEEMQNLERRLRDRRAKVFAENVEAGCKG